MQVIHWRSAFSALALALFVGSLGLFAAVPINPFSRVLDLGVAPAFLEPPSRYSTTQVLSETSVALPVGHAGGAVVFASQLATIRVTLAQYDRFRETWPGDRSNLPDYSDLVASIPDQLTMDDGSSRVPVWLIQALLESGTATVTDERSGSQVERITVREEAVICGPLCGNTAFVAEFLDGVRFFRRELTVI